MGIGGVGVGVSGMSGLSSGARGNVNVQSFTNKHSSSTYDVSDREY
jgi:hypothetical protein